MNTLIEEEEIINILMNQFNNDILEEKNKH